MFLDKETAFVNRVPLFAEFNRMLLRGNEGLEGYIQ